MYVVECGKDEKERGCFYLFSVVGFDHVFPSCVIVENSSTRMAVHGV
jgi:hypothetical protein